MQTFNIPGDQVSTAILSLLVEARAENKVMAAMLVPLYSLVESKLPEETKQIMNDYFQRKKIDILEQLHLDHGTITFDDLMGRNK